MKRIAIILVGLFLAGGTATAEDAASEAAKLQEAARQAKIAAEEADRQERKKELADLFKDFKSDFKDTGAYRGNRIYDLNPRARNVPPANRSSDPADDPQKYTDIQKGKLPNKYKTLKCSEYDYRVFSLCPEADFFEANARVYFDNGKDEDGEVDLFENGNLEPALQFAAVRLPWRFGRSDAFDPWSWGPELSAGLGTPGETGEGEEKKSTAPIVLVSAGLRLTYNLTDEGSNFSFEVGRVFGFTTDESFGDNDDSATYVGIKIKYVPQKD